MAVSCRSTEGTGHDEIVKTSIDLANAYAEKGMFEQALETYDLALNQVKDYRLSYNRALCYAYMGDYEGAASLMEEAKEIYPETDKFEEAEIKLWKKAGKIEKVEEIYLERLSIDENDTESRLSLAKLFSENGEKPEAYEQALILWDQNVFEEDVVSILYEYDNETWKNVMSMFN